VSLLIFRVFFVEISFFSLGAESFYFGILSISPLGAFSRELVAIGFFTSATNYYTSSQRGSHFSFPFPPLPHSPLDYFAAAAAATAAATTASSSSSSSLATLTFRTTPGSTSAKN